ncbi:MAG: hypothetical protein UU93_C0034G0002 [Candidatus Amesbacteria bacterium GW2011_GWA2_42_12]|uniref:Uncharacterized protein n=1 Tax=Candidatus Amesbacteria bacterium GW2011_GWA2_42_12 TaxID=1618356 RepID=A0A0G0Y1E2_9BACT|nr:MAG: hypothetical protein UU93_C0034G0002 [Candidatus Amesbacteria bacterium GW2011_GWA2_42_12]
MKKQKVKNPFANLVLDEEEKSLETALGNAGFEEDSNFIDTKAMLQEAAKNMWNYTQQSQLQFE